MDHETDEGELPVDVISMVTGVHGFVRSQTATDAGIDQDVAMNRLEPKVPQDATATDNSCKEIGMPGFDIRLSPHHSMAAAIVSTKNAEYLTLTRLRRQSPHHSHQVPRS